MLCIPKANHRKLIDECYPPPKNLANIGPEYKPNGNETSRLAYYGNRKPEKLTKVGKVLEQKAALESKGVLGSGQAADKAKGSLMVTLGIIRELVVECHRDINYFSSSATYVIDVALQSAAKSNAGKRDLDITARSAAVFYALANYLHSSSSAVDAETMRSYLSLVGQFAKIAVEEANDGEQQNRVRMLGLGACAGAIGSDAFFTRSYTQQLSYILPALLANVDARTYAQHHLQDEADKIAESGTASCEEYTAKRRPVSARKVPSFSVDGEKPLRNEDIYSAAMGNVHAIIHNGDSSHVQGCIAVLLDVLNGKLGSGGRQWANKEWCCWLAQSLCSWTALQYRFIVPTNLVEYLVEEQDSPTEDKQHTLVAMITSLLGGKLSMIGLSTSDTANNLLGFAVRRVHYDAKDALLPSLVGAIGSLGTHVYYHDQLNDLAEEITARIASLELPQSATPGGTVTAYSERKEAKESIRLLLGSLVKLIGTAQQSGGQVQKGSAVNGASHSEIKVTQAGTRSRISPSVFHQTASLLSSPDNWVRQSFEEVLLSFLANEVQPASLTAGDAVVDTLGSKLSVEATGFTHSLSAAMYVLATSKVLYAPSTNKDSPLEALPIIERSNKERKLNDSDPKATALPIDYSALVRILDQMIERIPVATILGVVPALLAMNKASANLAGPRQDATNAVVASTLSKIGDVCGVSSLKSSGASAADQLPTFPPTGRSGRPLTFEDLKASDQSSSGSAVSADTVISGLANSKKLQAATDLDAKALQNWFGRDWNVQIAVDDSYVGASPFKSAEDDAVAATASRFASPAVDRVEPLMNSTQAVGEGVGGVGVDDFRQALGNRSYGKADYTGLTGLNGSASAGAVTTNGGDANGTLTNGSTTLDKRASRRVSRKISQPVKPIGGPSPSNTVSGLLDSMRVGLDEEPSSGPKAKQAPYVP